MLCLYYLFFSHVSWLNLGELGPLDFIAGTSTEKYQRISPSFLQPPLKGELYKMEIWGSKKQKIDKNPTSCSGSWLILHLITVQSPRTSKENSKLLLQPATPYAPKNEERLLYSLSRSLLALLLSRASEKVPWRLVCVGENHRNWQTGKRGP